MNNTENSTHYWSPHVSLLLWQIHACYRTNVSFSNFYEPFDITPDSYRSEKWCPRTFDGLLCWDATPAGALAYQNCPNNVEGWVPERVAFKQCDLDGNWYMHPLSNKSWTNYTTCIDIEDLQFREVIMALDMCYYAGSFVTLSISLYIFYRYKLLNNLRTIVHSHLFAAHQLSSFLWLIWNFIMLKLPMFIFDYQIVCLTLAFARMYFTGCCYAWMFNESIIIYRYLVSIENDDYKYYTTYKVIGWVVPLVLTTGYFGARWYMGELDRCTIESSYAIYIVSIPALIGMLISAWIFCKVCKVICNKTRTLPGVEGMIAVSGKTGRDIAKTTRAAGILFFLFGLHMLIMPTNPPVGTVAEKFYAGISSFIIGNQGTVFSILFCFCNDEVRTRIRVVNERTKRLKKDLNQIEGVTGGETYNVAEDIV